MKVAIIGAGLAGLTAAYKLGLEGHQVTVIEKGPGAGGLAGGFQEKDWEWSLEYFYHHLFPSDSAIKQLAAELGLAEKLFFTRPKTSIFYQNRVAQMDSPLSLLKLPFLSPTAKARTALVTLYLKLNPHWQSLEKTTAYEWLERFYGDQAFQVLWKPLIDAKFGPYARQIAAAWFWARIKKRESSLGYFEGGFRTLVEALVAQIKSRGGIFLFNQQVNNLAELKNYDKIIVTLPTSAFLKIAPQLPDDYQKQLAKREMLGAVVLILFLPEPFLKDGTYWLNINEGGFPFVAVVEHTNFIDPSHYQGQHLLYVGGYYPADHQFFTQTDQEIFETFLPFLQRINPDFNFKLKIKNFKLMRGQNAQPVVPINYRREIPSLKTPLPNVYLANLQQIYPWDRGTNYSVELGGKVARLILEDVKVA